MRLTPKAFHATRHAGAHDRGRHQSRTRPLCFELLDSREMLSTSPFYVTNNSTIDTSGTLAFDDDEVFIAIYGQDYSVAATYYYFDATGAATPTLSAPPNGAGEKVVPVFRLTDLTKTADHTYLINLPQELAGDPSNGIQSGRMYFSMGASMTLGINGDGSVNGVPNNTDTYFDFVEFSLNAPTNPATPGNLNIDTTNVDQFGVPITIVVDSSDPHNIAAGVGAATDRSAIITQYEAFTSTAGDPFASSVWGASGTYGPYRLLNPSHVLDQAAQAGTIVQVQTLLQNTIDSSASTNVLLVNQSLAGFPNPASGSFVIRVGTPTVFEDMTVTSATPAGSGFTNWTVERGANSTTPIPHAAGSIVQLVNPAITATQTTLAVGGSTNFPSTTAPFPIIVDSEVMLVTALLGTNTGLPIWQVQRGYYGTQATEHLEGALVTYNSAITDPLNWYFNDAVDALFNQYPSSANPLTVVSNANGFTYTGHVEQQTVNVNGTQYTNTVLRFTSTSDQVSGNPVMYDVYLPFFLDNAYYWGGHGSAHFTPGVAPPWLAEVHVASLSPSMMVFSNNGVFADSAKRPAIPELNYQATSDQQKVLGDLEDQIVSALNRGVALLPGSDGAGSWTDSSKYYGNSGTGQPWNHYAQFLHKDTISIGGLNYGFAYDDSAGQASDIGVSDFSKVTITLAPWAVHDNPDPPGPDPNPPNPNPNPNPSGSGISQRWFLASTPEDPPPSSSPPSFLQLFSAASSLPPVTSIPAPTVAPVVTTPNPVVDAALVAITAAEEDQDPPEPVATIAPAFFSIRMFLSSSGRR